MPWDLDICSAWFPDRYPQNASATSPTPPQKLLEAFEVVGKGIGSIDDLKNSYISNPDYAKDFAKSSQALEFWSGAVAITQKSITGTLELCYLYHTSGKRYEPVLIHAWNKTKLLIQCPKCMSMHLTGYKESYIGYPLIYEHMCRNSSEVQLYQAIFPYPIHPLTISEERPIGRQSHPSMRYWVTVGEGFSTSYSQFAETQGLDELAKALSKATLEPSDGFVGPLIFHQIEAIRSLSRSIEKQIDCLESLRQALEIYAKLRSIAMWKIVSSESAIGIDGCGRTWDRKEDGWVCEEKYLSKRTENLQLFQVTTNPFSSKRPRTGGFFRRGGPYSDIISFSGGRPEKDLEAKTYDVLLSSTPDQHCNDVPEFERFPYPDEQLKEWAKELSKYLGITYEGHWLTGKPYFKTLEDARDYECYHVEKKAIVYYLIIHGIWFPEKLGMEKDLLREKRKLNHILRFYGSQTPCNWCQKFIENVTKRFAEFGLCIAWRIVPKGEEAERPGPTGAKDIDCDRVSMAYSVCGLKIDVTQNIPKPIVNGKWKPQC
ncbi:hypothetical protein TWF281_009253 [Arthrobotrys megalospora]